jgi:hypothetical protein
LSYPTIFNGEFKNVRDIKLFLRDQASYTFMGLIIREHDSSEATLPARYKIRNYRYEKVLEMRGNQASLLMRYLELKNEKKINKYLSYFPESKQQLDLFHVQFNQLIVFLYKMYVLCFIRKEILEITNSYYVYKTLKQIHWSYTTYLRNYNRKVDIDFVFDYFSSVNPRTQYKVLVEFLSFKNEE